MLLHGQRHQPERRRRCGSLIDGAGLPADAARPMSASCWCSTATIDDAVRRARERWAEAKGKGFEATYWQPDEQGRWVKKA